MLPLSSITSGFALFLELVLLFFLSSRLHRNREHRKYNIDVPISLIRFHRIRCSCLFPFFPSLFKNIRRTYSAKVRHEKKHLLLLTVYTHACISREILDIFEHIFFKSIRLKKKSKTVNNWLFQPCNSLICKKTKPFSFNSTYLYVNLYVSIYSTPF